MMPICFWGYAGALRLELHDTTPGRGGDARGNTKAISPPRKMASLVQRPVTGLPRDGFRVEKPGSRRAARLMWRVSFHRPVPFDLLLEPPRLQLPIRTLPHSAISIPNPNQRFCLENQRVGGWR